jgi:osmotically-inducible protein OsmY
MRKQFYKLALIVTLGCGFALAQGMPQQQPQQDKSAVSAQTGNADVQGTIQAALQKDPSLANSAISIQVNGKFIELSGTVPTKEAKDTAERIAKENAGEMKVRSSLKVSTKGPADNPPQSK